MCLKEEDEGEEEEDEGEEDEGEEEEGDTGTIISSVEGETNKVIKEKRESRNCDK